MGQFDFKEIDHKASGFLSDKWTVGKKLTLNIGARYDWGHSTSKTKNAIGPRFGLAYDVLGDGKTLLRGGVGKVYQYQGLAILATLAQRAVIAPTLAYDTTQVTSPITTGHVPGEGRRRERDGVPQPGGRQDGRRGGHEPGVPGVPRRRCAARCWRAAWSTTPRRDRSWTAIAGCPTRGRSAPA